MDIGTGSVKAVLLADGGVKEYREPYPGCRGTGAGPGLQDPGVLRAALKALLTRMAAEEPVLMRELNGICIDGHGPSIIFIDGRGAPVSEIITWQDRSAAAEADELREAVPGFTKDGTSYEAKVLRGVREHPEWAEPGCTVLYPKDYAVLLLTGERIIDRSAASTIYFYTAPGYTQADGRGLVPEAVFPKAVNPWEAAGTAGTEFSRECGLPSGTPVYAGGIDAFCEAVGAGGAEEGVAVDGTGTSTCVSLGSGIYGDTVSGNRCDLHVLENKCISIEMMSFTGGSVLWYLDLLSGENGGEQRKEEHRTNMARSVRPETPTPVLFLPYLRGERSPVWDERARGAFVGLSDGNDAGELFQSILQGIAFGIRENLTLLEEKTGLTARFVNAAGGGSESRAWLQIKADVTGKRYRKSGTGSAAAFGSALIAAAAAESSAPADLYKKYAGTQEEILPDEKRHRWYSELFEEYKKLYGLLKPVFYRQTLLEEERKQYAKNE